MINSDWFWTDHCHKSRFKSQKPGHRLPGLANKFHLDVAETNQTLSNQIRVVSNQLLTKHRSIRHVLRQKVHFGTVRVARLMGNFIELVAGFVMLVLTEAHVSTNDWKNLDTILLQGIEKFLFHLLEDGDT